MSTDQIRRKETILPSDRRPVMDSSIQFSECFHTHNVWPEVKLLYLYKIKVCAYNIWAIAVYLNQTKKICCTTYTTTKWCINDETKEKCPAKSGFSGWGMRTVVELARIVCWFDLSLSQQISRTKHLCLSVCLSVSLSVCLSFSLSLSHAERKDARMNRARSGWLERSCSACLLSCWTSDFGGGESCPQLTCRTLQHCEADV